MLTSRQHRTDAARRAIHALDAQRVLIFMNFQSRLKVRAAPEPCWPCLGATVMPCSYFLLLLLLSGSAWRIDFVEVI